MEVLATFRCLQEGNRGAGPFAAIAGGRLITKATVSYSVQSIHVRDAGNPQFHASVQNGIKQRVARRMGSDPLRTTDTAPFARTLIMVFKFDKQLADFIPAPAGATIGGPAIIIEWRSAHVNHAIDRTGTA